jgi:NAD(P)H-hydrate repair Nnr-like enzyme with NAD(P)H-hydrate epimerase domain
MMGRKTIPPSTRGVGDTVGDNVGVIVGVGDGMGDGVVVAVAVAVMGTVAVAVGVGEATLHISSKAKSGNDVLPRPSPHIHPSTAPAWTRYELAPMLENSHAPSIT